MKTLEEIFRSNKCDKIDHGYDAVYSKFFEKIRNYSTINLLEIGIWKGASVDSWLEYFPNINIYGIDIFSRIKEEEVPALKNPRMHYIKGDSTNPNIREQIAEKWGENIKFDIVIDDGLHTPDANRLTFNHISPFLGLNPQYYVEDIWCIGKMTEEERKHYWLIKKAKDFTLEKYNEFLGSFGEEYSAEHFDLRKSSRMQDSYIIRVTKNRDKLS